MPNLQGSTPTGGGPTLRCFGEGRAVIIFPIEEGMGKSFDGKEDKPYIRCNVVALPDPKSAPYITYGGEVMQDGVTVKTPDTWRVDLGPHGWMAENVKIAGGGMLYILRAAMRSNSARVGRLFKDPAHNYAWKLTDVDKARLDNGAPNPAHEPQLMEQAAWWLGLLGSQTFQNSFPVPIAQVPQQQAAPQQYAPQQPAPQSAPPAQQGWGQPAPQQPQPAYAATVPAQPQQPATWTQPQQPAPQAPQGWGAPQQVAPQQPQQGWGQPPAQAEQVPHPGF